MKNVKLLVIDAQNSFVLPSDEYRMLPGGHLDLCVDGAKEDMDNLAAMVKTHKKHINDIIATMDSHHKIHVASPIMFKDKHGNHPNPFTIITSADLKNGTWQTSKPSFQARVLAYVQALEANGRYPLCVWPPHCIIGTNGHNIYQPLRQAFYEWEDIGNVVGFLTKGSNVFTEHYSGLEADVPDPKDPSTQLDMTLVQTLIECDYLLISGEALTHCVSSTVRSIANNISRDLVKKFVLLKDATSPVKGFEHLADSFINDMTALGMSISDTKNFF